MNASVSSERSMEAFSCWSTTSVPKCRSGLRLVSNVREFVNRAIDQWYAENGIDHVKVCPNGPHLNPVERAIESLASLHKSGFFRSLYTHRLEIHHIRRVGSLAYIHVLKTQEHKKEDDNARIGSIVGYTEDAIGVQVYSLAKLVAEVQVVENVLYKDRHESCSR
ncbi:hypothetical protein PsorP6_015033 [Peronosclerospora sorghi]|uniref:Uncharacterized protein n=1 Tax=Peronosclerospora sorghi TaxID=230839 RepID=A0ACC0VSP9_9STRA|nr:hypothetical protein PsorP6_015033 [Peronosclerospora sorghi]